MIKWLLRRCIKCRRYTMSIELCPYCGEKVKIPHPAKFSPDDKYIEYRIKNIRTAEKLRE